ncbi:MAG TPA: RNA polymerase sigma-70 factor [Chryseosolibacter sp.]|nr:RNA polymerase sigma-70 factor [Chryseosolibacter sp.]
MDYCVKSDHELLLSFKSGDVRAFDELFNRHWRSLLSLAIKILDDDQKAEDVIQEAFVSLYENARERQIEHPRSYLYQTVRYQCFMQLRAGKISAQHLTRLRKVRSVNNVEEYINATELEDMLNERIEALPEKCREIFYLSRYELLSNKKIAEQLNISQKTVEHQLTKALKKLRLSVDKMAVLAFLSEFF